MANLKNLYVLYESNQVGKIFLDQDNELCFEYNQSWLAQKNAFALSHQLPLAKMTYTHDAQIFFGNLLPEGHLRKLIAGRLGLTEFNDFSLLEALGEDCAGAFRLTPSLDQKKQSFERREISLKDISEIYKKQPCFFLGFPDGEVRLSLAGAQDKVPIIFENKKLFLPQGGTASTHILKFPNRDYAYITENEYYVTQLAADCGLQVMPSQLLYWQDFAGLVINRYDRKTTGQVTSRIHQEDFCQILGLSFLQKYQQEGGPSFGQCFDFIEKESSKVIEDLEQLLRWLFFNLCVGNCDNHGKNLSTIIYSQDQRQLSPFYDLICTKVYPSLSKNHAMSIGGLFDTSNISAVHWHKELKSLNFSFDRFVEEICLPICDTLKISAEENIDFFKDKNSFSFMRTVKDEILRCTRRAEKSLYT